MQRVYEAMRAIVRRGRVAMAALNPKRTLVQVNGLANEVKSQIELMLPYGMSAWPDAGDVILLQVGNSGAHLVALCADNPALRIADLAKGEYGFRDLNGQQVVFRSDRIELTTPKKLVITVTGDVEQTVNGKLTQTVHGQTVLACDDVNLGGTGGKKVALDGDSVAGGKVVASSTKVKAV